MSRRANWEQQLHDYLAGLEGAAFAWGSLDCALFAAGAVQAMTGVDPAEAYRGRYSSSRGSVRALRRWGAGTLEATIERDFGEVLPAFAQRGDLVMVGDMIGVSIGADAVFIGEEDGTAGLVRYPRAAWRRCWSVI